MTKFHINPTTGNPGRCTATGPCPFGGESGKENHYDNLESAREAFENSMSQQAFPATTALRQLEAERKVKLKSIADRTRNKLREDDDDEYGDLMAIAEYVDDSNAVDPSKEFDTEEIIEDYHSVLDRYNRLPIAIDPAGCGCTECLVGEYVPEDNANESLRKLLGYGLVSDNT